MSKELIRRQHPAIISQRKIDGLDVFIVHMHVKVGTKFRNLKIKSRSRRNKMSYKVFKLINFPRSGGRIPENLFASRFLVKSLH